NRRPHHGGRLDEGPEETGGSRSWRSSGRGARDRTLPQQEGGRPLAKHLGPALCAGGAASPTTRGAAKKGKPAAARVGGSFADRNSGRRRGGMAGYTPGAAGRGAHGHSNGDARFGSEYCTLAFT